MVEGRRVLAARLFAAFLPLIFMVKVARATWWFAAERGFPSLNL
jgi:hypothetical protein